MRNTTGTWDQLLSVTQAKLNTQSAPERRKVALDALSANPDQPRRHFEPSAMAELVASVKAHGILQPILVRPLASEKGRYQIVAGERRWRAAKALALAEVPVVVRELTDAEALEFGLVENLLREDISPLEEARALKTLLDTFGYSYAQLGERLGKNKAYVDHRVRLLKMPAEIQSALERQVEVGLEGKLERPFTPRHAGVAAQLDDAGLREQLIETIFADRLSVAEATRRKNHLKAIAGALPEGEGRARLEAAVVAGMADRDVELRLAAVASPRPAASAPSGVAVKLEELAVGKLVLAASANGGEIDAHELLWALNQDRKAVRARLAEAEPGRVPARA